MVYDGDGLAFGRGDLVAASFKIDGVVIVDSSRGSQREVKVKESREGAGPEGADIFQESFLPNGDRDEICAAVFGLVLADEFHLKDIVGMQPTAHVGVGHESDEAALESSEAAFDFSFGLRSWGDEVSNAQSEQGALKLALGIGVIIAGAGSEKAQAVGVDGLRDPVCFKGLAEVGEVIPRGVGRDETPGDIEAGMVVNGEQENLLLRSWPPLVDRAVMLPEVADFGAAETPVGAVFSLGSWSEMGEMGFDVGLDTGARSRKTAETQQLIADELVIGRILERKKAFEKRASLWRPRHEVVAATGAGLEGMPPAQPRATELVETGFADPQGMCSLIGIHVAGVEV